MVTDKRSVKLLDWGFPLGSQVVVGFPDDWGLPSLFEVALTVGVFALALIVAALMRGWK